MWGLFSSFFQTRLRRTSGVSVDYRLVTDGKEIQSGGSGAEFSAGAGIVAVHPTACPQGCDDTPSPDDTLTIPFVLISRCVLTTFQS